MDLRFLAPGTPRALSPSPAPSPPPPQKARGEPAGARMPAPLHRHLPAAGRAVGLRGTAICGRVADYYTGDHAHIVRLAVAAVLEAGRRCRARRVVRQ